jgi:hypothetical protein
MERIEKSLKYVSLINKVFKEAIMKMDLPTDFREKIIDFISRRADKIPDVISRIEDLMEIGKGNLSAIIKSTEAERKTAVSLIKYIDLMGEERVVWSGRLSPEEYIWKTVVGVSGAKCSCPDSLWNIIYAVKGLRSIDRRLAVLAEQSLLFDKYQFCKHILTLLSILIDKYGVEPYRKHIELLSLIVGLIIIGREEYRVTPEIRHYIRERLSKYIYGELTRHE